MKITKSYVEEIFNEAIKEYNKILPIPVDLKLQYIPKDEFLNLAKSNFIYKILIEEGAFENLEKEFPVFLVLINNKIYVCFEILKDKLSNFSPPLIKNYLLHCFSHEITHIFENKFSDSPELFSATIESKGIDDFLSDFLSEFLAEDISDKISNKESYDIVHNKLWEKIWTDKKRKENALNKE